MFLLSGNSPYGRVDMVIQHEMDQQKLVLFNAVCSALKILKFSMVDEVQVWGQGKPATNKGFKFEDKQLLTKLSIQYCDNKPVDRLNHCWLDQKELELFTNVTDILFDYQSAICVEVKHHPYRSDIVLEVYSDVVSLITFMKIRFQLNHGLIYAQHFDPPTVGPQIESLWLYNGSDNVHPLLIITYEYSDKVSIVRCALDDQSNRLVFAVGNRKYYVYLDVCNVIDIKDGKYTMAKPLSVRFNTGFFSPGPCVPHVEKANGVPWAIADTFSRETRYILDNAKVVN